MEYFELNDELTVNGKFFLDGFLSRWRLGGSYVVLELCPGVFNL